MGLYLVCLIFQLASCIMFLGAAGYAYKSLGVHVKENGCGKMSCWWFLILPSHSVYIIYLSVFKLLLYRGQKTDFNDIPYSHIGVTASHVVDLVFWYTSLRG